MLNDRITILIVEDDLNVSKLMQEMLQLENYCVLVASNGKEALQIFSCQQPSLVLLDLMLPDIDGITICKKMRLVSNVGIIMVTGKIEIQNRVEGLYAGADDYIIKPFSYSELIARVAAVLRRTLSQNNSSAQTIFESKDLMIDFIRQLVMVNGEIVNLTATEYKVLSLLALYSNKVVSQKELFNEVWGKGCKRDFHTLEVNISRLRQKLEDDANSHKYIKTKPGQGYILLK